jgi:hypothetical protein
VDAIAELKRRLAGRPELVLTERPPDYIEVAAPVSGGFRVALAVEQAGYTVHFAGWHEHFESAREALNCFTYGLLGKCRLRVLYRGSTAYKWTLEHFRDGRWVAEGTTGSILFPFWRRRREVILSNRQEVAA